MGERIYRIRGLSADGRDQLRSSLLARAAVARVRFKPVESDVYDMTVSVWDGTGWVPGVEGLCRSLGGVVLADPRGA
jgi:hypothetical protein